MRSMKTWAVLIVTMLTVGAWTWAHSQSPSMVTWSSGDALTHSALNQAFQHLHNTFTAGIKDEHVHASAAIAHSKMATPALLPKAWGKVTNGCSASSTCTLYASSRVTSVARTATAGEYEVTLAYTPSGNFMAMGSGGETTNPTMCHVQASSTSAPHITFFCVDHAGTARSDYWLTFVVWE